MMLLFAVNCAHLVGLAKQISFKTRYVPDICLLVHKHLVNKSLLEVNET